MFHFVCLSRKRICFYVINHLWIFFLHLSTCYFSDIKIILPLMSNWITFTILLIPGLLLMIKQLIIDETLLCFHISLRHMSIVPILQVQDRPYCFLKIIHLPFSIQHSLTFQSSIICYFFSTYYSLMHHRGILFKKMSLRSLLLLIDFIKLFTAHAYPTPYIAAIFYLS